MHHLSIKSLQWAVGGICAFSGAAMLVVPHQFTSPTYGILQPNLPLWGMIFFGGGAAMINVAAFNPQRRWLLLIHLLVGLLLLVRAYDMIQSRTWTGAPPYTVLALGTIVAPFLRPPTEDGTPEADLLAILVGISFSLTGLIILSNPEFLDRPIYGSLAQYSGWFGIAFLISGLALLLVQLRSDTPRAFVVIAHLVATTTAFAWLLPRLSLHIWTATAMYLGLGIVLMLMPFVKLRAAYAAPASLQLRFALALAVVAALPLLLQATIATSISEQSSLEQGINTQTREATILARNIIDYVELHRAAVLALAAQPDLLEKGEEEQTEILRSFGRAYPEALFFATYDAQGQPVARSDGREPIVATHLPAFTGARDSAESTLVLHDSPWSAHPMFVIGAPVYHDNGTFAGVAAIGVETTRLHELGHRAAKGLGGEIYLVDQEGQLIVQHEGVPQSLADLSGQPAVAALLASEQPTGALRYEGTGERWLASYARLPKIGWGVIVVRPEDPVLRSSQTSRELAFAILMLLTSGVVLFGIAMASRLTAPLAALAHALNRLASSNESVPLPHSRIPEVAQVAAAFEEMRERLAQRTCERDRVMQQIREQREWLQVTLASIGDGIIATDQEGRVNFMNPVAEALTGWSYEEAQGLTSEAIFCISHGESDQSIDLTEMLCTGMIVALDDVFLTTRAGNPLPIDVIGAPIGRDEGQILGAVLVFRDITERKEAEEALHEQNDIVQTINRIGQTLSAELDLQKLVQAVTDATTELTGAQFGAFFYNVIDQEGERYTLYTLSGVPREAFERFPLPRNTALFGPTFRGESLVRLDDVRKDPRYGQNPPYKGMPEGHLPVVSYLAVPVISRSGEVLGGLFFGHSEPGIFTKRSEQLLEGIAAQTAIAMDNAHLYDEAQAAIRLRDQFLAVASHELKTPLTTVQGYTDLLLRRMARNGNGDGPNHRTFRIIHQEAMRLNHLIDLLLDLSRLQTGRLELDRESVDLVALTHRLIETTQPTIERHRLELQVESERLALLGDPMRLEQILRNLLSNAIKYSPDGGTITIRVEEHQGQARVAISDQGIGIPAEELPNLFTRFHRVQHAGTEGISGLGLGLYVVRHLVEAHGGTIEVDSEIGKGSTFIVTIPLE